MNKQSDRNIAHLLKYQMQFSQSVCVKGTFKSIQVAAQTVPGIHWNGKDSLHTQNRCVSVCVRSCSDMTTVAPGLRKSWEIKVIPFP